jgi:hypothetical protein
VAEDYPPILDAAQVAEMLSMNVQMVRMYAREGRIPAYRLPGGRAYKFFRDQSTLKSERNGRERNELLKLIPVDNHNVVDPNDRDRPDQGV